MVARGRERGAKKRAGDKRTHSAADDHHARCRSAFARSSGKRFSGTTSRRGNRGRAGTRGEPRPDNAVRRSRTTIPLRLPNEDIGKLALEAELREISLGQLVGMLIEAAMAQDLSRVLDK